MYKWIAAESKLYRIKFGLAWTPTLGIAAQILSYKFTFSCNSLVHDPALKQSQETIMHIIIKYMFWPQVLLWIIARVEVSLSTRSQRILSNVPYTHKL